jgi:glycosyltransferase involved in cell wall biosynthesis
MTARRLRVVMLVEMLGDSAGGGERFAAGLAAALARGGHAVSFYATRQAGGGLVEHLERDGVAVRALGRRGRFDVLPFRSLAAALRSQRVDVLHTHQFGSNVWGSLLGRACRVPVVVAHETTWSYDGDRLRRVLDGRLIGRLADAFVAVSQADADRMVRLEGVPPEKIQVIPNAVVPRPADDDGDLRAELGLAPDAPLVGVVAIQRSQKALDVLLDAFALVVAGGLDAHLALAGRGPCQDELRRQAEALGIAGRTHFLGVRQDLDVLLRAFDVCALSSDYEGTPLIALEAAAHGVPFVATRVGGLADVVREGTTGLLVPPRDPEALAAALAGLLRDPERRARMGAQARAHAAGFELEPIAERFAALYESLLERRGAAR